MPEAFSTPNLVALPITSKELGRGGFFAPPPTKIVLSNSPTTIGLRADNKKANHTLNAVKKKFKGLEVNPIVVGLFDITILVGGGKKAPPT